MNIAKNVERASLYFPQKADLIFEGRTISYEELNGRVNRLAKALRAMGVEKGDRIALFLPNIPAFPIVYLAVQKLGAIAVSINAMSKKREIKYIAGDSGCKIVFTTSELRGEVPREALPALEKIVVAEGEAGEDPDLETLTAPEDGDFACREMAPNDPAAILYTSGTTGFPKGATLTHGNVVSNSISAGNHSGVCPDDRMQLFLPLFHCFGQNYIMNSAFAKCATLVLHRRFEPEPVLGAIASHKVTMLFAVPTIFIHFLNMDTSRYDLSSLRYCFTAAATMPLETALQWKDKFGMPIHEGYGLTECSPFALYNHDFKLKYGSLGTPIENVDVRVVDYEGKEVPPGEQGAIVVRGPNVMRGYWGKPAETAKAIRDGWLHTGDIGKMDEEGYFFITDRLKDMIIAAGFNVYPNEVEQVLYQHPAVKEAAVYGVPDAVRGETVHAAIVLKKGMRADEEGIIDFCRANMAAYKTPRRILFMDELPKSPTGKILKRILRGDESS